VEYVADPHPKPIYLSSKMQVVMRLAGMPMNLEGVKAAKNWYDRTKRETNLANITLVQIEVENALNLATRGSYRRKR
jgi:hypothetical protein